MTLIFEVKRFTLSFILGHFPLDEVSSSDEEYAVPPDAVELADNLDVRCVIKDGNVTDFMSNSIEKAGYLNKMGSRTKSWKRRWFSLKDDQLSYYKSSSDQDVKSAMGTIQMAEIIGLTRVTTNGNASTADGFEVTLSNGRIFPYVLLSDCHSERPLPANVRRPCE